MGWFKRDAGRHSAYGVPDVTARLTRLAAPPPVAPAVKPPARLPDDRTTDQIGEKVADVLWGYYGQQIAPSAPLAASTLATATPTYDDSYDSALLDFPDLAPPPVQPLPWERDFQPLLQPWRPVPTVEPAAVTPVVAPPPAPPAPPQFRVFERVAPRPPAVLPVVTAPVAAPPAPPVIAPLAPVPVVAPAVAPVSAPVAPAAAAAPESLAPAASRLAVLEPCRSGVQLGFVDGTTLDLPRDDPAAKALRAAADALTLRE